MSEVKISEAAIQAACVAYMDEDSSVSVDRRCMAYAIKAALPHLHPQPAKLAEQQAPYIGMPVGEKTVARAVASLEQSLTFAQDFRPEDVRVVLAALAATGKQQVGVVQDTR